MPKPSALSMRCLSRNFPWLSVLTLLAAVFVQIRPLEAANEPAGAQVYRTKCARCHGPQGEGTRENKKALAGDLSVGQLADVIAETMPEDDVGSLSADESRAVAAYIHDAFYSGIARARNKPARIELSRLTVRQYRRSVADFSFGRVLLQIRQ